MIRWVRSAEDWAPRCLAIAGGITAVAYFGSREHRWRKALIVHAEGDVLELAVGSGCNFAFYNGDSMAERGHGGWVG